LPFTAGKSPIRIDKLNKKPKNVKIIYIKENNLKEIYLYKSIDFDVNIVIGFLCSIIIMIFLYLVIAR